MKAKALIPLILQTISMKMVQYSSSEKTKFTSFFEAPNAKGYLLIFTEEFIISHLTEGSLEGHAIVQ